ncbi:glutathione S-transferase [Thelonectria olida]|uniref:Glutathione S-transferase n=1 Tax=Thelonectria olida TaxID=1576542 RepID=A0A9P8VVT1_9HYPO|nr:glutathione S-transferase [Thelonectria olida]
MTAPRLTLYQSNGSSAFVPHAVLLHFGIPFTTILMIEGPEGYESADGTISHAAYLKIHPQGFVPVLDVDGETLTEVPALLNYIASLVPKARLVGDEGLGRARVAEWLNFLSGTLHGNGLAMLKRPGRFADDPAAFDALRVKGKKVVRSCFARIDGQLEGREFAVGDALTAADFYLYGFARLGREIRFDMETDFPNYAAHARRAEGFDGVRKAIKAEGLEFSYSG